MPVKLTVGAASATGPRDANEDAVHSSEAHGCHLLADGTGGRAGGKTAATIACEAYDAVVQRGARTPLPALVEAGFAAAHQAVRDAQKKNPAVANMTTTLVVALVRGDELVLGHVGDSRAYRFRRGRLELLTRDHSYANFLADNPGTVRAPGRPLNALMRAIGVRDETVKVDVRVERLEPGDRILLCSDGVTATVPDWLLGPLLEGAGPLPADQAANAILSIAHTLGSSDNASAIVLAAEDDRAAPVVGWLACLEGPQQGLIAPLGPRTLVGGDARAVDVVLQDGFVSPKHAEIIATPSGFQLRDLDSKNGTFVNESTQRVRTEALVDGDRVRFGSMTLIFRARPVSDG